MAVHIAHVGGNGLAELCAGCCRNGGDEVFGLASIEVERTRDAVVEESEVETCVPRIGSLPFKVRDVSFGSVGVDPAAVDVGFGTCSAVSVNGQIVVVAAYLLLTGHTVRCTELKIAEHLVVL